MQINLDGNTLTQGYFAGIVLPESQYRWTVQNESYTACGGDKIQADTSQGSLTITLPATPSIGTIVLIVREKGTGIFSLEETFKKHRPNFNDLKNTRLSHRPACRDA